MEHYITRSQQWSLFLLTFHTFYFKFFALVFVLVFFLIIGFFNIQLINLKKKFQSNISSINAPIREPKTEPVAPNEHCPLPHEEVGSREQGGQGRPEPGLKLRGGVWQIGDLQQTIQSKCLEALPCSKEGWRPLLRGHWK